MKFKIACGTDDGQNFTNEHFGDSKYFLIYECDSLSKEISFLNKQENNSEEEEKHGDPKKAKGISSILKDIPVLLAFVMGPNIVRMRKKFIPIISKEKDIQKTLEKFKEIIPEVINEIEKVQGEDKKVFVINN
jgi:predicted Fe-Mo cluster-binding NifX family protein